MTGSGSLLATPMALAHGPAMPNRFMLAPLTNTQSNSDGTLGDDEYRWLTMRAGGGFGLTMTCAAHVQHGGRGFPGQLGIWSDKHLPGLTRLAAGINAHGGLSAVQLQHSGRRSRGDLTGEQPVSPWDDAETGARALSTGEVEQLVEDFILAALRAEAAGFHGVELHGAHGYLLCQFLDADANHRSDRYGGSFENRIRILFEVINGIRARAGRQFQLGLRLSVERFGISIAEARALVARVMLSGDVDYIDLSLWDVFKDAIAFPGTDKPLIDYFSDLPRGGTLLGVAGKIFDTAKAQACLDHGADFVLIGRGAILQHDFARHALADPDFKAPRSPVSKSWLECQGVGPAFIEYLTDGQRGIVAV